MPVDQRFTLTNGIRDGRTSTWEFLPELESPTGNLYKFNETMIRDRHLFKTKEKLAKQRNGRSNSSRQEGLLLPSLNHIQLSLDIAENPTGDNGRSHSRLVSTRASSKSSSPRHSARFNESLSTYVSARKMSQDPPTHAYIEPFPRSLPSVDQTAMAKKQVNKRRLEQHFKNPIRNGQHGLFPLLQLNRGYETLLHDGGVSSNPDPQSCPRPSKERINNSSLQQSLHVWDPTTMDILMKSGKVLVPR